MRRSHLQVPARRVPSQDPKYDKKSGLEWLDGKARNTARKVQYAFKKKSEANTLRNYLNIHIGTINLLLVWQGLAAHDVASERRNKNQDQLRDRIEDSFRELREVRGNTEAQALAIGENNSMLRKLFWIVSGDIPALLRSLSQGVAKVWQVADKRCNNRPDSSSQRGSKLPC